jgi:predicted RNase H-like nuclease
MKRIILPVLLLAMVACTGPTKQKLVQEKDSLLMAQAEQDKMMNELVNSLVAIDENLQAIKEKENLIEVNMGSPEGNNGNVQDKINNDIQDIYNLMLANKNRIAELEQKIKESGSSNKKLNNLVAGLNRQLKEKSIEIIQLREELSNKNIQISSLNFTLEGMSHVIDSIRHINLDTQAVLDSTTTELYTAFYAFGTKKELKEHQVISNEGLPVIGKHKLLSEEFNEDYFTKVDIREVDSIPLFRPRIKVLTSHPEGSYQIITGEEETKAIKIIDKDSFWSISKFLVVQVN